MAKLWDKYGNIMGRSHNLTSTAIELRLWNFPGIFSGFPGILFQESVLNAEARKQASKQARKQASKPASQQASEQCSYLDPTGLCFNLYSTCSPDACHACQNRLTPWKNQLKPWTIQ